MRLLLTLVLTATAFAETHQFTPTKFYNTFSGAHPPVLHIKPGDHVVTSTIDARGVDAAGVQRGQRPNPETGPFFIDGAVTTGGQYPYVWGMSARAAGGNCSSCFCKATSAA